MSADQGGGDITGVQPVVIRVPACIAEKVPAHGHAVRPFPPMASPPLCRAGVPPFEAFKEYTMARIPVLYYSTCGDTERMPSEQELSMARFQGRRVATIATRLFG